MGQPHMGEKEDGLTRTGQENTVSKTKNQPESQVAESVETPADVEQAGMEGQQDGQQAAGEAPDDALAQAQQDAAEARDAMLRMHAEMENLRKRLIRDLERSRKRALEGFMNDLLPVRDSLERGLEAADETASVESLREGKALIMKMLSKAMSDHGLEEIDPRGEPFNPEFHEAISQLPSHDVPENTVMEVVQRGYRLNDRLIRPARVVVSRGPA